MIPSPKLSLIVLQSMKANIRIIFSWKGVELIAAEVLLSSSFSILSGNSHPIIWSFTSILWVSERETHFSGKNATLMCTHTWYRGLNWHRLTWHSLREKKWNLLPETDFPLFVSPRELPFQFTDLFLHFPVYRSWRTSPIPLALHCLSPVERTFNWNREEILEWGSPFRLFFLCLCHPAQTSLFKRRKLQRRNLFQYSPNTLNTCGHCIWIERRSQSSAEKRECLSLPRLSSIPSPTSRNTLSTVHDTNKNK